MPLIATGIQALDTMLFGDEYYGGAREKDRGFLPGDVVLIRGEPGSGKTTLALQIVSNFLSRMGGVRARFVSFEEPVAAMEQRCKAYGFKTKDLEWLARENIDELIAPLFDIRKLPKNVVAAAAAASVEWAKVLGPGTHAAAMAAVPVLQVILGKLFEVVIRGGRRVRHRKVEGPHLIVLDSLNAFMNLLMKEFPEQRPRLLFNNFCQALRRNLSVGARQAGKPDAPVIVIIGEHHFDEPDTDKYLPESFFCDVEIVLRPEPLRMPRDSGSPAKMVLGYDLSATIDADAKHLESRSFCRVMKSRHSRNQARRCAYDIEPKVGVRFFETYPGDGKLMLFAENEQQRASWGSFFQRDLTDAYPSLRYELFTMAGMETVYESSRRLRNVPLRTDMFLSSLDSYWVVGYRDYRLKTRINEGLLSLMIVDRGLRRTKAQTPASVWACSEYPHLVNDLVYYTLCQLELTLYSGTLSELRSRHQPLNDERRQRSDKRQGDLLEKMEPLSHAVEKLKQVLPERYAWLSLYLFGDKAKIREFIERSDSPGKQSVLPPAHLRETFLRPLPRSGISMYGQYSSDVLPSLVREDLHQFENGEDHWLCVPYDANIGIFVGRLDLLASTLRDPTIEDLFYATYKQLKLSERKSLEALLLPVPGDGTGKTPCLRLDLLVDEGERAAVTKQIQACIEACMAEEKTPSVRLPVIDDLTGAGAARLSWDQVICLTGAAKRALGVETRTFDTLLAFFLELVWNCGGRLEVDGRYEIRDKAQNVLPLLRALHYFGAIFQFTKTDVKQTVNPALFHREPGGLDGYGNWLFGRYWYSTLVDALTATAMVPAQAAAGAHDTRDRKEFVWKATYDGTPVRLEILKMPAGYKDVKGHFACWGEWNFALLSGSENVSLACDLISNLMGALKVTSRGLNGACLPPVSQFYGRYRDEPCIPATIRNDDLRLPRMTFGELGSAYLGTPVKDPKTDPKGIFRQAIFDYRHCAREIFEELLWLKSTRLAENCVDACIRMLRGIEELAGNYIFIRDSVRHDVPETARQGADRRRDWTTKPRRAPRINLKIEAAPPGERRGVVVSNISISGCCIEQWADGNVKRFVLDKETLCLRLAGEEISCNVMWEADHESSDGKRAGLAFRPALDYQRYGRILEALSGRQRAVSLNARAE